MTQPGVLDDLRVLDITRGLAGSVAGMVLADQGASVIRLDRAGAGDDEYPCGAGDAVWHRGKQRGIVSADLLTKLATQADILLTTPDADGHPDVDLDTLRVRNPRLIVCRITGYTSASDTGRPPLDILVQARSGLMDEQMGHRAGPIFHDVPLPSLGAAFLALIGVGAAVVYRDRTGLGQYVDTSLHQGVLAFFTMLWGKAETPSFMFAMGLQKMSPSWVYPASDGKYLHLHPGGKGAFEKIQTTFGLEVGEGLTGAAAAAGQLDSWRQAVATNTRDHWLETFWAQDVPVQPCLPPGGCFDDEQVAVNGMVIPVEHPTLGTLRQVGRPQKFSRTPGQDPRSTQVSGGDADEVARAAEGAWPVKDGAPDPQPRGRNGGSGPLAGIRILDLGNYLAGPFGPMLLADLGADVIKIEATTGDQMRFVDRVFAGCQRGKRDIALDFKKPEAAEVFAKLAATADVVHHNFRPGVADRLGFGYDDVRQIREDAVYCETPAYGSTGPRATWGGFDQLFQALCGFEVSGGGKGNPPMWHRTGFLDYTAAMLSASAILFALHHRNRTGEGQRAEVSILSGGIFARSELCFAPDGTKIDRPELDGDQTGYGPLYRLYPCSEGWLALAAHTEASWEALRRVEAFAALPAVYAVEARIDEGVAKLLGDTLATRSAGEWQTDFDAAGVPCEVVREAQEEPFLTDPEHLRTGLVATYPHPEWGEVQQVGVLVRCSDAPSRPHRASPLIGEHSQEILDELGYAEAERAALAGRGVTTWPGA